MKKDSKTFIKLFGSYILIIIIPVMILGFLTLGILFNNLANDTKKLNNNILEQCGNILDSELEKMLTLSYRIEKNEALSAFAASWAQAEQVETYDVWKAAQELGNVETSTSLCREIAIYFKNKQMIITNETVYSPQEYYEKFFSGSAYSFEQWQEAIDRSGKENYFLSTVINTEYETEAAIIYCRNLTYNNQFDDCIFFSRINTSDMIAKIAFAGTQNIELGIVDKNGKLILQSAGFEAELLANAKKNSNNMVEKRSNMMNLKYVYQLPGTGLHGNVYRAMLTFLLLLALTIFISFALASVHSRRMQRVMLNMFDEIDDLKGDFARQFKIAKEKTLLNLMHNAPVDEAELKKLEQEYTWFETGSYRNVMVVSLAQMEDINIYMQEAELVWGEIDDQITQRLEELEIQYDDALRIDLQTCIYVLGYENKESAEKLKTFPAEFLGAYNFRICLGIGEEIARLKELNIAYDGAISALRYSMQESGEGGAYYADIKSMEITKMYYTAEKEQRLMRSVRLGEEENVKQILDEIYRMNFQSRHLAPGTLKRLMTSITITIYKILDENYASDNDKYEKFGRVCRNLERNDNMEEAFRCLEEICLSLCRDSGKTTGRDTLRKQMVDYIAAHYQDDMLALETLAEHLDINYYYLSRLFKELLGTSFVRYLTAVRLEKAKQLLEESDETIEQIAKATGFYRSDSLIRTFKKYYGITPSKYRKQGQ